MFTLVTPAHHHSPILCISPDFQAFCLLSASAQHLLLASASPLTQASINAACGYDGVLTIDNGHYPVWPQFTINSCNLTLRATTPGAVTLDGEGRSSFFLLMQHSRYHISLPSHTYS